MPRDNVYVTQIIEQIVVWPDSPEQLITCQEQVSLCVRHTFYIEQSQTRPPVASCVTLASHTYEHTFFMFSQSEFSYKLYRFSIASRFGLKTHILKLKSLRLQVYRERTCNSACFQNDIDVFLI